MGKLPDSCIFLNLHDFSLWLWRGASSFSVSVVVQVPPEFHEPRRGSFEHVFVERIRIAARLHNKSRVPRLVAEKVTRLAAVHLNMDLYTISHYSATMQQVKGTAAFCGGGENTLPGQAFAVDCATSLG